MRKMLKVLIRVPGNIRKEKKKLSKLIMEFCENQGLLGAIIVQGIAAYGEQEYKAGLLRGMIDLAQIIDIIDDPVVIQQVIPKLKELINDHGLMTIEEVYII